MEQKTLELIDCHNKASKSLALHLLDRSSKQIKTFYALYYLFESFFQGHQFVELIGNTIVPAPDDVINEKDKAHFTGIDLPSAFHEIPANLIDKDPVNVGFFPIVQEKNRFYLQKNYLLEKKLVEILADLYETKPSLIFNQEDIDKVLLDYKSFLTKEQQHGIRNVLESSLHLLTGGPGTGKSYTVYYLLKAYLHLCKMRQYSPNILVAAPTGKAASALKAKLANLQLENKISVMTIHKALRIGRDKNLPSHHVYLYDLIIVDESSMIDSHLFYLFFSALSKGTRLLLMGDRNQLPPVESGMIFGELTHYLPSTYLTICKRVENKDLLSFGENLLSGHIEYFLDLIYENKDFDGVSYESLSQDLDLYELCKKLIKNDFSRSIILTPMKIGPYGSIELNKQLFSMFEKGEGVLTHIPILVTKTQYELGIYNGEVGYYNRNNDELLFYDDEGEKKIPLALLDEYEISFAMTVHKSQGSEYEEVILFLPKGSEKFGNELLYTAVTRAKKKLTIDADEQTFLSSIRKKIKTANSLCDKLREKLLIRNLKQD